MHNQELIDSIHRDFGLARRDRTGQIQIGGNITINDIKAQPFPFAETIADIIPISAQERSIGRIQEGIERLGDADNPIQAGLRVADIALEGAGLLADFVPGLKLAGAAVGGGIALLVKTQKGRSLVNKLKVGAGRPLTKPVFNTETAVTDPQILLDIKLNDAVGLSLSKRRLSSAVDEAGGKFKNIPFETGQGVWGTETNPVFMQLLPTKRNISKDREARRFVAQVSENLTQEANALMRFNSHVFNDLDNANALVFNNVTPDQIKKIGAAFSDDMVIAARPGGKLLVTGFDDKTDMRGLLEKVKTVIHNPDFKTGISNEGIDRIFISRSKFDDAVPTFQDLGAIPQSNALGLQDILRFQDR